MFSPCAPGGIQTHDLQNRNLTFYSAELRGQCLEKSAAKIHEIFGFSRNFASQNSTT